MKPKRSARYLCARRRAPYVFIAPALLIIGGFQLLPIVFSILIAFTRWDALEGLAAIRFAGLENFRWVLFDDDWFGSALGHTLWHTLVSLLLVHSIAIPLAAFIDLHMRRWRSSLAAIYLLPFITSSVVLWSLMMALFSPQAGGLINSVFNSLAAFELWGLHPLALIFPSQPVNWWGLHGRAIGVTATLWQSLGWNLLLYLTALQYVPKALYEAARMDGANGWQELRHISIPQLRPMICFATCLSLVSGVQGGGRASVAGYMHHTAYQGSGDFGAVSAMGVSLLPLIGVLVWLLWAYVGGRPALPDSPRQRRRGQLARALAPSRRWLGQRLLAPASRDPQHLRGFAGMRAIACLLVIGHHFAQRLDGEWALWWFVRPLWQFFLDADSGVSLFFVLSGALLARPYWQRYLAGELPPALGDYAARRAVRILPAYFLALTLAYLAGEAWLPQVPYALERYLAGMSLLSALHYRSFFPVEFNPVLWSISLECMCYALLPLLLRPLWRLHAQAEPRRALRYLLLVLLGLQVLHFVLIAAIDLDASGKGWRYGLVGGAKSWLPYWNPASFMSQFLLGSIASFAICWGEQQGLRRQGDFDRLAKWALAAAVTLQFFFEFAGSPNLITRQPYLSPLLPALLALALFAMHFGRRVHRVLDNRVLNFIATISFGLYLWHWPVLECLRLFWEADFRHAGMQHFLPWAALCATALAVSLALACLSWWLLERPPLRAAQARLAAAAARKLDQGLALRA